MAQNAALTAYKAGVKASKSDKPRARAKKRISLAIVGGLSTQVLPVVGAAVRQDWPLAQYYLSYNFTGYDPVQKAWDAKALIRNWTPTLIGAMVHWGANKFGINRMVRKFVPFVEV